MDLLLCLTENTIKILQGLSGFLVVGIILLIVFISKHKKREPAEWRSKSGPVKKESKKGKKSKKESKNNDVPEDVIEPPNEE